MIGVNLYKKTFHCKGYKCGQMIGAYPCTYCGFKPTDKNRVVDGERIR